MREGVNNTGLQKKFPRINFQYLVSFSPSEYEYENLFSYHVKIFQKNMTKV